MNGPIEALASVTIERGAGLCEGCGAPSLDPLCLGCETERWDFASDEAKLVVVAGGYCLDCGDPVEEHLLRFGSIRCQDCRDVMRLAA